MAVEDSISLNFVLSPVNTKIIYQTCSGTGYPDDVVSQNQLTTRFYVPWEKSFPQEWIFTKSGTDVTGEKWKPMNEKQTKSESKVETKWLEGY